MPIELTKSREHITTFLNQNHAGVLATADKTGRPHAATIYITYDQQFNMYFVTKKDTQKNRNVKTNPRAAIAIFDQASQTTVQAEGTISEVTDPDQQEWVFNDIWNIAFRVNRAGPPTTRMNAGGYVVYKLSASALRLAKFNTPLPNEDDHIFEVIPMRPTL
ncbi:MAG TPA: pyridoxamine 5'-phosphate oxidase family protein [Candidatus Saccharimonadales bacterium]|nr:pyridoxamine 5'-phosphate oxidase family protein [Candidatus Saccharimonadales bacterium]